jgi:outer membrane receptor protein involved in Fe transport
MKAYTRFSAHLSALILLTVSAFAQDYRATIIGLVTDANKAAIPNAKVRVKNERTGVSIEVSTTADGLYTAPLLNPDTYTVEVSASGFKTARRTGVVLQVADKQNLPFTLEAGELSVEVTISGEQQLVQTETASRGQNFDPIKMQELPLNGRQVYMLLNLTPGVVYTQEQFGATGWSGTRGWDVPNGSFSFNGSQTGTSQYLLNGAPISTVGAAQLAPNAEAIQEFKVMTNTYDAQYGRTSGGTVNTTLKAGTSQWHGSVFNYHRNRVFDANSMQNKLNTRNNPQGEPRGPRITNQFGGVVGFPLFRDKDFVLLSFEGFREKVSFPILVNTVPADLRDGKNFSKYGIKIYDPLTTRLCVPGVDTQPGAPCRSTYIRDPFPNNEIPADRISPIGKRILDLYPLPNFNEGGLNQNFIASDNTGLYHYNQPIGRWDHVFNERHRMHTIVTYQHGDEFRSNNGFPPPAEIGQIVSERTDQNYIIDYTWVQSPTSVWNYRISYGRFTSIFPDGERSYDFTYDQLGIKSMPLPPTIGERKTAPRVQLSNYSDIIGNSFSWDTDIQWDLAASLRQTRGRHSLTYGAEYAYIGRGTAGPGRATGLFTFNQNWTRQYRDLGQGTFDGYSIAGLLLGYMDGGQIDWNDSFYRTWPYIAGYVQDDWKVRENLTLNLGLRYDLQMPWVERFNRANAGFDFSAQHPNSAAIIARWSEIKAEYDRTNPLYPYPDPPAAILGGRLFADGDHRRVYDIDWSNVQPRIGVAWSFMPKAVLRAGFGIFHPTDAQTGQVSGFNQSTGYINSLDQLTPSGQALTGPYSLEDPFPDGLIRPGGADAGPFLLAGGGVSFDGRQRPIRRNFQYSFGLQFELPWASVLEVGYVGSRTNKIPVTNNFNGISIDDLNRGFSDVDYTALQVPNPFKGFLPDTVGLGRNDNTSRGQLLRPYPGYGDLQQFTNAWGRFRYDSLQLRVEKRAFNNRNLGVLTFILSYSWSKNIAQNVLLNQAYDSEPVKQLADLDKTHTYAFSGVWDLPFGKGRRWFANRPGVVGALIDGWNLNWIHQYYSGYPVGKPDAIFSCGSYRTPNPGEGAWFNNDRSCYTQRPPNTLRVAEERFAWIRNPNRPQMGLALSRWVDLTEKYKLQIKAEAFNAFNTPIRPGPNTDFTSPDFGRLPRQQNNFPRNIQLAAKFVF